MTLVAGELGGDDRCPPGPPTCRCRAGRFTPLERAAKAHPSPTRPQPQRSARPPSPKLEGDKHQGTTLHQQRPHPAAQSPAKALGARRSGSNTRRQTPRTGLQPRDAPL